AFAYANIDNVTHASIDDEARVTAAQLTIEASDDVISWAVTGALNQSESAGVGLSIAINDVTASTKAFIGENDHYFDGGSTLSDPGKITAEGVSVNARTDGRIETISFALAVANNSDSSGDGSDDLTTKVKNALKSGGTK